MQLPTDLLRTLAVVADTQSFTRAGEIVHRTQSAVSMQIRRLEDEVGSPLFLRTGKRVILTSEGETLLGFARRILVLHDEAVAAMSAPDVTGVVRLGSPDDFVGRFLPEILAGFAEAYPRVRVEVICEPSPWLVGAMERGELDLAINSRAVPNPGEVELRREPTAWVTSARHFAHEKDPVPLALFQEGCFFRNWAFKALESMGRGYRVAYVSPSVAGIQAAVAAGLAVTLLARSAVPDGCRVLGPEDGFPSVPSLHLVLLQQVGPRSPAVDSLARHVIDGFREPGEDRSAA